LSTPTKLSAEAKAFIESQMQKTLTVRRLGWTMQRTAYCQEEEDEGKQDNEA